MKVFCETLGLDYARLSAQVDSDMSELMKGPVTYEINPITRGASNRGYCRIFLPGPSDHGLPLSSLILMVLSDPDPHKGIEEVTQLAEDLKDLPYINVLNHLRSVGVSVPELYHYNREAGLLYIEDFGSEMLRDVITGKPDELKLRYMEAAIDELVKLQVSGTRRENPRFLGFKIRFDEDLLFWELNHFTDYAIRDRMPGKPGPEDEKVINDYFRRVVNALLEVPYVLTHRDYQLDNLLVQDDKIKVIDFQDALMGPLPYDLACLLYDRDTADILGDELIEHLVYYYADKYGAESGKPLERDEFRKNFDLCVLHRALKVVGRFYYIKSVKKRDEFLKWIPPMCRALRTYLKRCPETAGMQEVLARYLSELGE